jgi:uncharacterized protein (TIGR02145 family)/prepilin-type N-terminal cleavage/methylation domain-containing protein
MKNKAFTLIELLIVIGIIAILAAAVIIAINPGQQFASARDATRQGHINSIEKAVLSYLIDNTGALPEQIEIKGKEICKIDASDCTGLIDLSSFVPQYISSLPVDPQGGVNSNGTGYFISKTGLNVSVSAYRAETKDVGTGSCPPILKDERDNNIYTAVQIGNQCWTAENMKYLPSVVGSATGSTTDPYYYVYDYQGTDVEAAKAEANYTTYGVLYNKPAALTACPEGWHLPSDNEWHVLESYLATGTCRADRAWPDEDAWDCSPAGTILKANSALWSTNTGTDNYGFSALPGGYRYAAGTFGYVSTHAYFWSSSSGYSRGLYHTNSTVYRRSYSQANGFSVRCLRD